jgi:hypothetical protein
MRIPICIICLAAAVLAQKPSTPTGVATVHRHAVAPENLYHHIIAVVPYTGAGTYRDPKRPMYVPVGVAASPDRAGIIGFTHLTSDDGKFAIVEYVAVNRAAFSQIYADKTLTVYEKGKDRKAVIEAAMQKYKRGFSLDHFGVAVR